MTNNKLGMFLINKSGNIYCYLKIYKTKTYKLKNLCTKAWNSS